MTTRLRGIALLLVSAMSVAAACAGPASPTGSAAAAVTVSPASASSSPRVSPPPPATGTPVASTDPPVVCPPLTFDASASLDPVFAEEYFLRDESDAIAADFVEGLEHYYADPAGTDPCTLFTARGIESALLVDARFAAVARGELRIEADLQYLARNEGSHDLRVRPPTVPVDVIFDIAAGAETHTPPDGPVSSIAPADRAGYHVIFSFDGHRWLADHVGPIGGEWARYAVPPAPVPPGPPCTGLVQDPAGTPFDDDGADRVWCDGDGDGLVLQRNEQVHMITRYWCDEERAAILTIGLPLGARIDPLRRHEYVRDPDDAFLAQQWITRPFRADVDLPDDAVPSGWTNGNIDLWISPSEIERALYVQVGDRFERWPRAARYWGVIDCN